MGTTFNFPITNLTVPAAQQYLQNDGLETLGLTTVALSPHWSTNALNQNAYTFPNMTLNIAVGNLRAPFRGILSGAFAPATSFLAQPANSSAGTITLVQNDGAKFPAPANPDSFVLEISKANGSSREFVRCSLRNGDVLTVDRGWDGSASQDWVAGDRVQLRLGRNNRSSQFYDSNGAPLAVDCAVFRFHPQAALRLERLMIDLITPNGAGILPVPAAMVIQNSQFLKTDQFFDADDPLTAAVALGGQITFHDGRGLIVDPLYVASVFDVLLTAFPQLKPAVVPGAVTDANGIRSIATFANWNNTTAVHVVDMHGANFNPVNGSIQTADPGGANAQDIAVNLPFQLPANKNIQPSNTKLRIGWMGNGLMDTGALTPPTLPANGNLARRFYRVAAIDLDWALQGNRSPQVVHGIQAADQRIPETQFLPQVRDQIIVDYLVDGMDVLAEGTRVLANTGNQQFRMAVSPVLDSTMDTPAVLGPPAHWPQFPAQVPGPPPAGFPVQYPTTITGNAVSATNGQIAAAWAPGPVQGANNNVVVTLTGVAMFNDHIRIYPQRFVPIAAIAAEPSFERGDGGSAQAATSTVQILLVDPFGRVGAAPPDPAQLTLDIVVTPRGGRRRLWGAVNVGVNGTATLPPDQYAAATPALATVPTDLQGISGYPLFGLPAPQPAQGTIPPPSDPVGMAMSLAAEPSPRQAPRLPTMARFETMLVAGDGNGQSASAWDAVLSGARWSRESRSAAHNLGNPGNPPGPDIHAPGVRVTGGLAYDIAHTAFRRVQPMYPWPQSATTWNFGWSVFSSGPNFDPPTDPPNANNTSSGAMLRTVAIGCESSLLAGVTPPQQGKRVYQYLEDLIEWMGFPRPDLSDWNITNEDRIREEIRREICIATHGLRDAQYSLLRAISEARELIYIESPQFAQTAKGPVLPAPDDTQVELVGAIAARLLAVPNLKVVICTPRLSDFHPSFQNWARQHYIARRNAVETLLGVAPDRVAVFHPVGFPGRTAFIRTTSVIVDDVWSLVGATHFRRRGMTFDGSVAVASLDRMLQNGYSLKVRAFRRALMAAKLRVASPAMGAPASGDWIRLERPDSAFALVQDLLQQDGLGRIEPLWTGPDQSLNDVIPASDDQADPDGTKASNFEFLTTISAILDQLGR